MPIIHIVLNGCLLYRLELGWEWLTQFTRWSIGVMEYWNASACIPVGSLDRCFWNRTERQPLLRAEYILAPPSDISLELHHSNTPSLQYSVSLPAIASCWKCGSTCFHAILTSMARRLWLRYNLRKRDFGVDGGASAWTATRFARSARAASSAAFSGRPNAR
jgi:hypothetical protein